MRGSATPRSVTALAALAFCAAGCTICPDPFDYSGPVPNGSAPQNDFRARSNGIVPFGSHPIPWPPVVQAPPRPEADRPPAVVAAAPAADQVDGPAGVQPVAAEGPVADAATATPQPAGDEPAATVGPEEPVLEAVLPPPPRPRAEVVPPLRETPGWKPRG